MLVFLDLRLFGLGSQESEPQPPRTEPCTALVPHRPLNQKGVLPAVFQKILDEHCLSRSLIGPKLLGRDSGVVGTGGL